MGKEVRLGKNIKYLRKIKKLTQTELADKLEVSQNIISRYENNQGKPTLKSLVLLADILNVSLEELVYGNFDDASKDALKLEELVYWNFNDASKDALKLDMEFEDLCNKHKVILDGVRLNSNEIRLAVNYVRFERFVRDNSKPAAMSSN